MADKEIRWIQRYNSFSSTLQRLNEAVAELSANGDISNVNTLILDGLIQRFEFTHELAWKTMKDFLEYQGVSAIMGARDAIRHALQNGLIDDDRWMDTIADRDATSHTYDQTAATAIALRIIDIYTPLFNQLCNVLKAKASPL